MGGADLKDLQVKVISFSPTPPLLNTLKRLFPQSAVEVQTAVDVREIDTDVLLASNAIAHNAANSIEHGRRWHHELPTKGAVGLAHAVRLALQDDVDKPLLLFEEDCRIHNEEKLRADVSNLLTQTSKFDLAVFGIIQKYQTTDEPVPNTPGWIYLKDMFWGLHCVLYSAQARPKVAAALTHPLSLQIDSLYGSMAKNELLTIWTDKIYRGRSSVAQAEHASTIQAGDLLPPPYSNQFVLTVGCVLLGVIVLLLISTIVLAGRVRRNPRD